MNTRRVVPPVLAGVLLLAGCAPRTESLRPLVAPTPSEGIVVYVSGGVQVSRDGAWIDVEPGDTVGARAVLRTDADGYCELKFGDTVSVRVEPETEFRCGSVALDGKAAVNGELTAGAILAKVKKLSGSDLQVRTPSTMVGVRGTAFKVSVSGNTTTVTVREGTVRVAQEGTTVDVEAGQRAEAALDAAPTAAPAAAEDLEAIDAFEPSTVDAADVGKLVKVLVVAEPADTEIWLGSIIVGRGSWGAVFEEGVSLTLYLKHDGYEPAVVFVPEEGRKAARIVRKLKPKGGLGEPAVPQAPSGAAPTVEAPATAIEPGTAPDSTLPESGAQSVISPVVTAPTVGEPLEPRADAGEPAARGTAPLRGAAFRVDPAIGNDPFFKEMARQFARQAPGFSLVTGPGSANLDAAAWPRGADVVGGIDKASEFTYERLPQLVAAKLVRPLDGWFEWTQLSPALVEAVRVGGKVYGVPIGGSSPILYYNRDLVGEAPGSWAEIGTLREMLAPNGGETLVMPMNSTFHMGMFVESRGVSLLVPDTVRSGLGTPQAGRAYDAMQEALQETGSPRGLEYDQALALFRERKAALFVDGPQSFSGLRAALGNSLGVATLPSWGTPPVAMRPYANVLSLFVSSSVNDDQAAILKRFFRFLLEEKSQLELCLIRLKMGTPIAPALRLQEGETVRRIREETVVSALYRQLETAVPMPRGPLAGDAWWVFGEVLAGLQRREPGQVLADMAAARFVLYGLEKKQVPAGGGELRAVIDPPEKSQGLFFRPWNKEDKGDEESDLRFVELGGSRGVVSIRNLGTLVDRGELSYVYLVVSYAPYRAGKAPPLRGQIEYFDEPNATLRIVYDSKDASVREDPQHPGAFKEARVIQCRGTRTWQTAEFPILDARFDGWCAGADLRIEVVAKGKIPAVRAVVLTPVK